MVCLCELDFYFMAQCLCLCVRIFVVAMWSGLSYSTPTKRKQDNKKSMKSTFSFACREKVETISTNWSNGSRTLSPKRHLAKYSFHCNSAMNVKPKTIRCRLQLFY